MNIHEGSFVSFKPVYVSNVINAFTVDSLIRLFDTKYNSINQKDSRQKLISAAVFRKWKAAASD